MKSYQLILLSALMLFLVACTTVPVQEKTEPVQKDDRQRVSQDQVPETIEAEKKPTTPEVFEDIPTTEEVEDHSQFVVDEEEPVKEEASTLQSSDAPKVEYQQYTPEAYEQARAEGKIIFLDFHAEWCPSCRAQKPMILEAFTDYHAENVAAFEVNYDTDKGIREELGVTYQNTKIIVDAEGEVALRTLNQLSAQDIHEELEKAVI